MATSGIESDAAGNVADVVELSAILFEEEEKEEEEEVEEEDMEMVVRRATGNAENFALEELGRTFCAEPLGGMPCVEALDGMPSVALV